MEVSSSTSETKTSLLPPDGCLCSKPLLCALFFVQLGIQTGSGGASQFFIYSLYTQISLLLYRLSCHVRNVLLL